MIATLLNLCLVTCWKSDKKTLIVQKPVYFSVSDSLKSMNERYILVSVFLNNVEYLGLEGGLLKFVLFAKADSDIGKKKRKNEKDGSSYLDNYANFERI